MQILWRPNFSLRPLSYWPPWFAYQPFSSSHSLSSWFLQDFFYWRLSFILVSNILTWMPYNMCFVCFLREMCGLPELMWATLSCRDDGVPIWIDSDGSWVIFQIEILVAVGYSNIDEMNNDQWQVILYDIIWYVRYMSKLYLLCPKNDITVYICWRRKKVALGYSNFGGAGIFECCWRWDIQICWRPKLRPRLPIGRLLLLWI